MQCTYTIQNLNKASPHVYMHVDMHVYSFRGYIPQWQFLKTLNSDKFLTEQLTLSTTVITLESFNYKPLYHIDFAMCDIYVRGNWPSHKTIYSTFSCFTFSTYFFWLTDNCRSSYISFLWSPSFDTISSIEALLSSLCCSFQTFNSVYIDCGGYIHKPTWRFNLPTKKTTL